MYVPKYNEEHDIDALHAFMRSHPLAAWVTQTADGLIANHIPFLIDASRGERGTLMCHVARANPVWSSFSTSVPSMILFQGADAYITPSWYPSKQAHGKTVPTWNYAVVHAYGMPRIVEDRAWLRDHLNRLTDTHEADRSTPWKVADAPADFIERLLDMIVGIEIPISKLIGKWKVSQNRPEADKRGVVAGLLEREDARAREMAALVREHVTGDSA